LFVQRPACYTKQYSETRSKNPIWLVRSERYDQNMVKKKPYVPPRLTEYDSKNAQPEKQKPTPTLLICDDNPSIRYLLRTYVESRTPFEVCGEAEHGMDAIEKAKQLQPDLVLLDLSMPVMTGAEAAVILKRTVPRTKIILFSMHLDDVSKSLGTAIGVDLTLSKSDGISKLADHLRDLLSPAN
jgi:CheY-like chemotaxis protein